MSYWSALNRAETHLGEGRLLAAEAAYDEARRLRDQSPGRVFLSETMGDTARRLWRSVRGQGPAEDPGRWERACRDFQADYRAAARALLSDAEGLLGARARPSDLTLLSEAVGVLSRSALQEPDPERCAPLLHAALAAARAAAALPAGDLLPPPGFLAPPAAARAAGEVLALLRGPGAADADAADVAARAAALLDDAPDAAALGHLRGELLEHAHRPDAAAAAYLAHLAAPGAATPERDAVRLRAVHLLANLDAHHLPVPRYDEALALLADAPAGSEAAAARDRIRRRRPAGGACVWAVLGRRDERWWAVLWADDRPRDAAWCDAAADPATLTAFLEPCAGRLLALADGCPWTDWTLPLLLDVLAAEDRDDLAEPPAAVDAAHPSLQGPAMPAGVPAALAMGARWAAQVRGLAVGDPALRTGIHSLARLGDGAAALVASFLPPELMPGTGWPLAPLSERPAPHLALDADPIPGGDPMTDLAQAGDAIVTTGRPDRAVAVWGGRRERWRLVLDRPERLRELGSVLELRGGRRTVLPPVGAVDDPDAALADLEALAAAARPGDLLPLLHWLRLARTHNGDLTDGLAADGAGPGDAVRRRYRGWVLERRRERRTAAGRWHLELEERAATSAVVVGGPDDLLADRAALARRWGLPGEARGAWILCDAAVLLWRRRRTVADDPLPAALRATAAGTLLINTAAVFRRSDLEEAQAAWLGAEDIRLRAATDVRPPLLELAGHVPVPDARVALGELTAALLDHAQAQAERGAAVAWYLPSAPGPLAAALRARADGLFGPRERTPRAVDLDVAWSAAPAPTAAVAVLPRLESLSTDPTGPPEPTTDAWRARDAARAEAQSRRRRLLSLEINAWLAAGAEHVLVADARWWREFPGPDDEGAVPDPEAARRRHAGDAAILWQPSADAGEAGRAGRAWLQDQGWLESDGQGLPPGWPQVPTDGAPTPRLAAAAELCLGPADVPWFHLLRDAWRWAEAGPVERWLLVVADEPPPGAAELAAAAGGPAASVLTAAAPAQPGALVWIRPDALHDPALRRRLAAARPAAVWVSDLRRWLPSDHGAGLEYVGVLRFLLRDLDGRVVLHASHLPAPWRDVLARLFGRDGAPAPCREVPPSTAAAPPVSVLHGDDVTVACPGCAASAPLRDASDHCPACGLNLLRWLPAPQRAELPRRLRDLKVAALQAREPDQAEQPLCVWAPSREADAWIEALEDAGVRWRRARRRSLGAEDQDGSWLLCLLDDQPEVPSECRHALLVAPQDAQELADLRQRCGSGLLLCHHPLDGALADDGVGRRPRALDAALPLRAAELHAPPELTPPWRWEGLLPPRLQEMVSGSPAAHVRRAAGALNWLAAVETAGPLDDPANDGDDHPRARLSRLELVYRGERLDGLLTTLLPALLADLPPGAVGVVDLAALPLDLDHEELAWCDRVLLASSLRLDEPGLQLLYEPDGGLRHGTHRRLGCLGAPDAVAAALRRRRDALTAALGDRLGEDTPARDDLSDDLLEAGVLLGAWTLDGPARPDDLPAAAGDDPLRLPADLRRAAADLLRGLAADRERWQARLDEAWRVGFLEDVARVTPAPAPPAALEAPAAVTDALAAFLDRAPSGQRLVEGPRSRKAASAVVAALARACAAGLPPRRITVIAPDRAAAARFHALWRRALPDGAAPETIVGPRDLPVSGRLDPSLAAAGEPAPVTVVLGLEALPSTLRYRLANRAREQRLLLILEPLLLQESREHLLPTQPDPAHVLRTDRLLLPARTLRDDLADLVAAAGRGPALPRTARGERGVSESQRVAGLDDALARLDDRLRDLALTTPVELVAPVPSDLETLGRNAARLGWLPVYGWELDNLRLPGVWEFLLAVSDASATDPDAPRWLDACLDPPRRREAAAWFRTHVHPDLRLHQFWALLARARWTDGLFQGPREAARIAALILAAGDDTVARYAARPLLEVWRLAAAETLGRRDAAPSGPVLTLTTPERAGEGRRRAVVYLCTGREADRQHYAVLSRADDLALSLWQDQSPLPRERGES